jgi:hypothetical protein
MVFTAGGKMFKGERLHSMQAHLIRIHDDAVFMSYDTAVMLKRSGVWYERDVWYSVTTSRQKSRLKRDLQLSIVKVVPDAEFKRLLLEVIE